MIGREEGIARSSLYSQSCYVYTYDNEKRIIANMTEEEKEKDDE